MTKPVNRSDWSPGECQGACGTTTTPRYWNPECACDTYQGNLGPCLSYDQGHDGTCAACDHDPVCHAQVREYVDPVTVERADNLAVVATSIRELPRAFALITDRLMQHVAPIAVKRNRDNACEFEKLAVRYRALRDDTLGMLGALKERMLASDED